MSTYPWTPEELGIHVGEFVANIPNRNVDLETENRQKRSRAAGLPGCRQRVPRRRTATPVHGRKWMTRKHRPGLSPKMACVLIGTWRMATHVSSCALPHAPPPCRCGGARTLCSSSRPPPPMAMATPSPAPKRRRPPRCRHPARRRGRRLRRRPRWRNLPTGARSCRASPWAPSFGCGPRAGATPSSTAHARATTKTTCCPGSGST